MGMRGCGCRCCRVRIDQFLHRRMIYVRCIDILFMNALTVMDLVASMSMMASIIWSSLDTMKSDVLIKCGAAVGLCGATGQRTKPTTHARCWVNRASPFFDASFPKHLHGTILAMPSSPLARMHVESSIYRCNMQDCMKHFYCDERR